MSAPEPTPTVWESPVRAVLFALPYFVVFTTVALGAAIAGQQVTNPDTYFHLRYGAEFWGHWSPWHPGSVTRFATRDWLPTQWLTQIVMGRVFAWFGLPGIAWLTGLWVLGLVVALFCTARRWAGALPASVLTFLAVLASTNALSGRPQVLSYVLMTVVVGAWIKTAEDLRPRWWLLAIGWIWPLLHGMWLLGIVTSAVAAVGVVVDHRRELDTRAQLRLLALPVGMAVAGALTPIGPGLYAAVGLVGSRSDYFTEWGPPDYQSANEMVLAMLVLGLVVAALRQGRTSWFVVAMIALTCGWAVYSLRTVPIAAATAAPLAAYVIGQRFDPGAARRRLDQRLTVALAGVALVVLACVVPFSADQQRPYPAWAHRELDRLPAHTAVLAIDYDGSYLMWAHPDLDVVAHGYGDSFTDAELKRNRDLYDLRPSWQHDLREIGARVALLPDDSSLAHALETSLGWRVRHESDNFVWLTAP